MDFLTFVSLAEDNDLYMNAQRFLEENDIFIHIHHLANNSSLLDKLFSAKFVRANKLALKRYLEKNFQTIECRDCNRFQTSFMIKAIEDKIPI